MSNRQRNQIEAVISKRNVDSAFYANLLPTFSTWLTSQSAAYLQNGIGSAVMVGGGTGYTASSFTVPLPSTAPGGSVPAVISFTNASGVLSAPVVTTPGSGYGTGPLNVFIPSDTTGSGASVTLTPANTDWPYNYTPAQVIILQYGIAVDYAYVGTVLQGSIRNTTATTVVVDAAGTSYKVGDLVPVTQSGTYGLVVQVATITGGGSSGPVGSITIINGGIGATAATGLATTGGSGTGLTVSITAVGLYNFATNTTNWAGWGF
jgi:hypothetical protein